MPGEQIRYQGGAPLVVRDKVLIGGYGRSGFVDAYDTKTGEHLWRWNVLPKVGEAGSETWAGRDPWKFGGGPMWHTGTYDPELNLAYWATGQANPDFVGDIRQGDNLYTESVVALDPETGAMVGTEIKAQTVRVLENLKGIVEAAGSSLHKVVKTTVFLKDMNDFAAMNEIYAGYFAAAPPARSTVEVARLPKDARVEIEVVALL